MKEANWNDCLFSNSSIKITPDKAKAMSLIETADGRICMYTSNDLNEQTANYVFEGYYSSVLELLHAVVLLEGYKVNNHVCLGFFLRDVLDKEDLFLIFDDCRYKRNSLVYYGQKLDFATAIESIKNVNELISKLKKIICEKL